MYAMKTSSNMKSILCFTILFVFVDFCQRLSNAQEEDVADACVIKGRNCARHSAFANDLVCCEGLLCDQDFWWGNKSCIVDPDYVPPTTTAKPLCALSRESCLDNSCCETLKCIGPRQAKICSDTFARGQRTTPRSEDP